jgi:tRNA-dihydrouridine synthase A
MMDWTDRHCRYFLRLLCPGAGLYTEMLTAAAIEHGDREHLLSFDSAEHPVAIQLGGSEPGLMARAAAHSAAAGYDEININVGCPSDRVQSGRFGACLMAEPERVARCYSAMQAAVDVPVTIKTRIGIDEQDSDDFLWRFVETLGAAGCRTFIVHARIALLDGLSPKENRCIPPLNYDRVTRLKAAFPELAIVLNGGVDSIETVDSLLDTFDGVMIGRRAYQDPFFLAQLEQRFLSGAEPPPRRTVVERMLPYIERRLAEGERLNRITRHMLGLFANEPGARTWRRYLSEHAHQSHAGPETLLAALDALPQAA